MRIGHGTAAGFDIGENLRCNVASKQLKFGGQFFPGPTPLVPERGDILSDHIEIERQDTSGH